MIKVAKHSYNQNFMPQGIIHRCLGSGERSGLIEHARYKFYQYLALSIGPESSPSVGLSTPGLFTCMCNL